jgi:hypothetical protein
MIRTMQDDDDPDFDSGDETIYQEIFTQIL